jgi:D-beta-D-heptose 7-phosphate kinase/D-beta-D-heptose 1-phosphate adenosyltransferase
MYLAERGGRGTYIPTAPREVYDVTGAGDIVLTFFGFLAAAGMSFDAAAEIANLAAGIEVGRIGTEIISRDDLARALQPVHASYETKIVSEAELKPALERERRAGRKIAFTNGCFDLLHAGHLQILAFAVRRVISWSLASTVIAVSARLKVPSGQFMAPPIVRACLPPSKW